MKHLKIFESWINESLNPTQVADKIQAAVGGLGTDEAGFLAAITEIKSAQALIAINQVLKANPDYSYTSVGRAIDGELGFMDNTVKTSIQSHLKKIGALAYLDKWAPSDIRVDIIKQILPRVIQHEGLKSKVYRDTKGILTIGVGFNLSRGDSGEKLKAVGANPVKIKAGKSELSDSQIKSLLASDLESARTNATDLVKNFKTLPSAVQGVLIEMTFNLGKKGLSEFKNFLAHIENKKFQSASKEMLNSSWARQVGARAITLSNIIKTS